MDQYRPKVLAFQKAAEKAGFFYVFDTETTGVPDKDERVDIIEFSAVKVAVKKGLPIVDTLDLYINPGYPIPEKITELTGITQEKIDTDGVSPMEAFHIIHDFWGDQPILCGYNSVSFDEPLVNDFYRKTIGASFWTPAHLDVCVMAREKVKANKKKTRKDTEVANHKLATMAAYFNVDDDTHFHEAIEDVKATLKVMKCLMPMYQEAEPLPKDESEILTTEGLYITYISHFKKSYNLNRIYAKTNLDAKIYYDIPNHTWYVGNHLPKDEVIQMVLRKAGVSNEKDLVDKYEKQ